MLVKLFLLSVVGCAGVGFDDLLCLSCWLFILFVDCCWSWFGLALLRIVLNVVCIWLAYCCLN